MEAWRRSDPGALPCVAHKPRQSWRPRFSHFSFNTRSEMIKATNKTFEDDWIFTNAGSTVIDVYPGDGDWTRLFSNIVGPAGRVFSFVPAEVTHFKNDPFGRMRTLATEPDRENVEAVSADLVAMPEVTQQADVLWLETRVQALIGTSRNPRG